VCTISDQPIFSRVLRRDHAEIPSACSGQIECTVPDESAVASHAEPTEIAIPQRYSYWGAVGPAFDGRYMDADRAPMNTATSCHASSVASSDAKTIQTVLSTIEPVHFQILNRMVPLFCISKEVFANEILQELLTPSEDPVDIDYAFISSSTEEIMYYIAGKRYRIPLIRSCTLPLAEVTSPNFNYHAFKNLWSEVMPSSTLTMMTKWMTTDTLARQLYSKIPTRANQDSTVRDPTFDISALIRAGVVAPMQRSAILTSSVFRVPKSGNQESRFIFDGRKFDSVFHEVIGDPPDMPLPQITDVIDEILKWQCISSADAKSMFYQFRVHESLSRLFSFRLANCQRGNFQRLCLQALPMGICFAPAWAQHVSCYLSEVVKHRCPHVKFEIICWVDNYIILTNSQGDDAIIRESFERVASEVNLVLKTPAGATSVWQGGGSCLQVLGIQFDLERRQARPSQDKVSKLNELANSLLSTETVTVRNRTFIAWAGLLLWMTHSTARFPLCFAPHTMHYLRQVCRSKRWDETFQKDDTFAHEIMWLTRHMSQTACSSQSQYDQIKDCAWMWTDASTKAIGVVAEHAEDRTLTSAICIDVPCTMQSIFQAEFLAGYIASLSSERPWVWIVDNAAAAGAILKGHSGNRFCDFIMRGWIRTSNVPASVVLVPSNCQIADPVTRPDGDSALAPCGAEHTARRPKWRIPHF